MQVVGYTVIVIVSVGFRVRVRVRVRVRCELGSGVRLVLGLRVILAR